MSSIYGPNASGKTNLLKALLFLKNILTARGLSMEDIRKKRIRNKTLRSLEQFKFREDKDDLTTFKLFIVDENFEFVYELHLKSEPENLVIVVYENFSYRLLDEKEFVNVFERIDEQNNISGYKPQCEDDEYLVSYQGSLLASLSKSNYFEEIQPEHFFIVNEFMKKIKNELNRFLKIEISKIDFDDSKKEVIIKLDRSIETYSTGEINYLSFLIRIYEFISSDNDYLIIDDPVSSVDLVNHYRMTYELVKRANNTKKLIILTHSVSLLNTINSQHKGKFKFYYLEKFNDKIYIDSIDNFNDNVITLTNIKDNVDDCKLIEAIIKREENFNRPENVVFHFNNFIDVSMYPELTNQKLIDFINDFEITKNDSFLINSYFKIKTIVALRVWLEYKMWNNLDNNKKQVFMNKNTLGERINYLTNFNSVNDLKTKLMKSKVMLNQGSHYQSQIMPFAYAINISLDDLKTEVETIKNIFNSKVNDID